MPFHALGVALALGATFVARGFAGELEHLSGLIKQGINHKGFALIDILQPCVVFNHKNTFAWYKERVYKLEETGYKPDDKMSAFSKSQEWGDRIPIGVFYQTRLPTFEEQIPALNNGPLVKQKIEPGRAEGLMAEFL